MRVLPCLLLVAAMVASVDAFCYLEDANAACTVCWTTAYSSATDKTGVTTTAKCPETIKAFWATEVPNEMFQGTTYKVTYGAEVSPSAHSVKDNAVAHANIHSCISSRGACTPFVGNTPGLATHTAALKGTFNSEGKVEFTSDGALRAGEGTSETYTIIAHIRYFIPNAQDATLPATKMDIAVGVTREVKPEVIEVSQDSYIMTGVLGAVILVVIGAVSYTARSGMVDFERIIEIIYSDVVTCAFDILMGLGDVAAFTVCVFTVVTADNALIQVLPACYLFLVTAWLGSLYNAYHDSYQLYNVYMETHRSADYTDHVALRYAKELLARQHKQMKEGGYTFHCEPQLFGEKGLVQHVRGLCQDQQNYEVLLELEMTNRDLRRKRGDIITLITESIPVTGIQIYILSQGETVQLITIIVMFVVSAVFGAKLSGLGTYKECRVKRNAAEAKFEATFHILAIDRLRSVATAGPLSPAASAFHPAPSTADPRTTSVHTFTRTNTQAQAGQAGMSQYEPTAQTVLVVPAPTPSSHAPPGVVPTTYQLPV